MKLVRQPRFQVFWPWVRFPVYTPRAMHRWSLYQARWWAAPFHFFLQSWRGLRSRFWPAKGRLVQLEDLLAFHPPGRSVCPTCRGSGIDRGGKNGGLAVRFCPKMMASFQVKAGFRVVSTRKGPRWLKGYEPERLVR